MLSSALVSLLLAVTSTYAVFPHAEGVDPLARSPMHRKRHFGSQPDSQPRWKRAMGPAWSSKPTLRTSQFTTGVAAMQLTVVDSNTVLIIDKAENNPLQVTGTGPIAPGVTHPAWMTWLNFNTGQHKALDAQTNSFCAGGSWLSNGTMISIGGNPRVNAASYYNANGLTGVRLFSDCNDQGCTLFEEPKTVRLASSRWYPGSVRLQDGSIFIMGGMTQGGFNNAVESDNPTIEYFPVKALNNGIPTYSKFLHDSLLSNLFPVIHLLPGGLLFVAANERSMIYNWQKNIETPLPNTPNGLRLTYPYTPASALLPLTIANKWTPTVLFCGGSTIDENVPVYEQSAHTPASRQCLSMVLSKAGMKKGWVKDGLLPEGRVMGETVITPDGKILILNGAKTGLAGYANVHDPIGQSNADGPTYRGVIYDPLKKVGKRLSPAMPVSKIPRMYHSVASLIPSGEILITGSNPNQDVTTKTYQTDYRIEFLSPPYMSQKRPSYTWKPDNILYGKSFKIIIQNVEPSVKDAEVSIVLIDVGYHTHGVAVDQKLLELKWQDWDRTTGQVRVNAPKDGSYLAPGYAWLFVVVNGVPSVGGKVMMGNGADPPFDAAAYKNMMAKTAKTYGKAIW